MVWKRILHPKQEVINFLLQDKNLRSNNKRCFGYKYSKFSVDYILSKYTKLLYNHYIGQHYKVVKSPHLKTFRKHSISDKKVQIVWNKKKENC